MNKDVKNNMFNSLLETYWKSYLQIKMINFSIFLKYFTTVSKLWCKILSVVQRCKKVSGPFFLLDVLQLAVDVLDGAAKQKGKLKALDPDNNFLSGLERDQGGTHLGSSPSRYGWTWVSPFTCWKTSSAGRALRSIRRSIGVEITYIYLTKGELENCLFIIIAVRTDSTRMELSLL